jgi:hypothetical protein
VLATELPGSPHLGSRDWPSAGPQSPAAPETKPLPAVPCLGPCWKGIRCKVGVYRMSDRTEGSGRQPLHGPECTGPAAWTE